MKSPRIDTLFELASCIFQDETLEDGEDMASEIVEDCMSRLRLFNEYPSPIPAARGRIRATHMEKPSPPKSNLQKAKKCIEVCLEFGFPQHVATILKKVMKITDLTLKEGQDQVRQAWLPLVAILGNGTVPQSIVTLVKRFLTTTMDHCLPSMKYGARSITDEEAEYLVATLKLQNCLHVPMDECV